MKRTSVVWLLVIGLGGCGGGSAATTPTTPQPTPTPLPTPTPTPTPENLLPETYCVPAPPPLHNIRVKVGSDQGYKKILDSRALVESADWCASIGYPGSICVVKNELDPQAVTCNNLVMGQASDTGRYGPTWSWNGQPCRPFDTGGDPGCRNHETNQFLAYAFGPGFYLACGANGVCNGITIQ
jgi:hypothetical protein